MSEMFTTVEKLADLAVEGAIEKRTVPMAGNNVVYEYRLPQKEVT